jgi:small nuclear ribonucleoprotein (snRNP)-like protein
MTLSQRFDLYTLGDVCSVNETSPIEYVRGLMGKQIAAVLVDGRVITGCLVALDSTGSITTKDTVENYEDHERALGNVICSIEHIQVLELRE